MCSNLVKAAEEVSKDDLVEGRSLYEQAVELYLEEGKYATGAKYQQVLAVLLEKEGVRFVCVCVCVCVSLCDFLCLCLPWRLL
jgi:hypothetical protein